GVMRSQRRAAAKSFVVDRRSDAGPLAANRAVRVAAQIEFAEFHFQRVEMDHAADQGLADAKKKLERLDRLDRSDNSRQHTKNAGFRTIRDRARRGRLG